MYWSYNPVQKHPAALQLPSADTIGVIFSQPAFALPSFLALGGVFSLYERQKYK
jgi:hypothetical protein